MDNERPTHVTVVICGACGYGVYSRTRHDMMWCSCKKTAADGGFDYLKIAGTPKELIFRLPVEANRRELYDDWNKRDDRFGSFDADRIKELKGMIAKGMIEGAEVKTMSEYFDA